MASYFALNPTIRCGRNLVEEGDLTIAILNGNTNCLNKRAIRRVATLPASKSVASDPARKRTRRVETSVEAVRSASPRDFSEANQPVKKQKTIGSYFRPSQQSSLSLHEAASDVESIPESVDGQETLALSRENVAANKAPRRTTTASIRSKNRGYDFSDDSEDEVEDFKSFKARKMGLKSAQNSLEESAPTSPVKRGSAPQRTRPTKAKGNTIEDDFSPCIGHQVQMDLIDMTSCENIDVY